MGGGFHRKGRDGRNDLVVSNCLSQLRILLRWPRPLWLIFP